jgi:outer membrane protein assembly factor BamB
MSDITTHASPQPSDGDITAQVPPPRPSTFDEEGPSSFLRPAGVRPRVWPAVILIVLQWLLIIGPRYVVPGTMMQFMIPFMTPMVIAACLALWWLGFSRLPWWQRPLILVVGVAMGFAAAYLYDPSFIAITILMLILPRVTTVWVLWLLLTPFLRWPVRCAGLLTLVLLTWAYHGLLRFDGVNGSFEPALSWRWKMSDEDRFMAGLANRKKSGLSDVGEKMPLKPGDWPGFRGPERDGRLAGVRIATDWQKNPPKQLWKIRVGPGWGSFAVVGDLLYTQEQRGDDEAVVCFRADTGEEVWAHTDKGRFTEVVAGPGPRATPTYHDGKIYAYGATGRLNCLVATTGRLLWSRDVAKETDARKPEWGFASSPLVVDGIVSVFAGGPAGKSVAAYDAVSGEPAWTAGEGQFSYCSPHLAKFDNTEVILITTDTGLTAIHPTKGTVVWKHSWPIQDMARIVQPTLLKDNDVLIGTGMGIGTRRIHVAKDGDEWTTKEIWTSKAIKPYFNDLVIYENHLYGFDSDGIFTCVSLDNGKTRWRERGYGSGQVLLLADQGLLLILSETGDVVLVEAKPDGLKELGRLSVFDPEVRTWNHPVVAHGKLFMRNGAEMACYQLTEDGEK